MSAHTISIQRMVLNQSVQNPIGDGRSTPKSSWHKRTSFSEGTRFVVETFDLGKRFNRSDVAGVHGYSIRLARTLHEVFSVGSEAALYQALLPHLEAEPCSVRTILEDCFLSSDQLEPHTMILEKIVAKGIMTVQQVKELVEEVFPDGV